MVISMSKKKKTNTIKKKQSNKKSKPCNKKCEQVCTREKVCGEPTPVKPLRPVGEYYNLETGEIYPKIFFKESWWTRFLRFIGFIP